EKMAGEDVHETIQERVMCLNADTGAKVWQHTFPVFQTDIVTSRLGWTNLAADPATGNIYAHGTQGTFLCLDGKSGKVIWQKSMGEEYGRVTGYGGRVTSPIVDENLAILGMCSSSWGDQTKPAHRYVAFDKNTGEVVWWSEPAAFKGTYYSAPVIATINGQRLLISGGSDGSVFALKVRTGEPVWHYVFSRSAINSTPVVNGNFVYIGHGEENDNPINNIQGRVICVDASEVVNGVPKLVWSVDDIHARYASPVYHDDRLYMPDDSGNLYCLDPKTGEELWKFKYGQGETRGSPVIADGKIYVGEVASRFHILEPGPKKCKRLDKKFFAGVGGVDVELNGTPAIANGRVYFSTSDEIYCIGTKNGQAAKIVDAVNPVKPPGKIAHLQIVPAEVALHSGGSATFKARAFDADGNFIKEVVADWSLPEPKAPPGAKSNPPALKGVITKDGKLTVDAKMPSQQSIVVAKFDGIAARARVRVVPQIPYVNDFEKIPDGAVPAGWINTQGKYLVKTIDGNKVLAKVNDKFSPLASRGHAYITLPTAKDYTIECDVYGTQVIAKNEKGDPIVWSPEMGVGANRYTLSIAGETKKLRIQSWDALPRIDRTVKFNWMPNTWYRLKLTTEIVDGKGIIRGKAWARGQKEPEKWTLEVTDSRPIVEGSAALYSYVTGNFNDKPGTEIYFDNLRIAPNKAPAGAGGGRSAIEASSPDSLCIVAPYQPMSFGPRLTLLGRPRR
ncbi:MAG: PQQ-binding-like beta-propeller repeat protein, partial [Planctomycetes bacterium]|nr:PQQ-binding-like beta-propeller repeat protein [Planctomycetota bacterium]